MRTILLLRGVQGSGKSTFVKENNLEAYTLSTDNIRLMLQSPVMTLDGFAISQKNNQQTFDLLYSLAEDKMKRGDFIVIDATNTNDMINKWKNLADYYKYTVFVKEFEIPLEIVIERNKHRGYKNVPRDVVIGTYEKLQRNIPSFCKKIKNLSEIDNYITTDLSKYDKLIFIGDVHGCYSPLKELFRCGVKDDTAYIFLGDYIDRGLQNKEVMEFLLSIYKNKNVFMLEGNHEGILNQYSRREFYHKPSFEKTSIQIEDLSRKDLKDFYKRLLQCMKIKYHNYEFMVSHGGIPFMPEKLTYLATEQLIKGVGTYEDDIDGQWNMRETMFQVHGHRSLMDYPNSISLENGVEFGGDLKTLEVVQNGMKIVTYKNDYYDEELSTSDTTCKYKTQDNRINQMLKSRYIKTKKLSNNILSLNFSRMAFKKNIWNNQTIKARGLFVDAISGKVVARSFEKFFNLNQNEFTLWDNLNLKYPVKVYKKENGFLGILSHHNGDLAFYSKSTNNSIYAGYFKSMFMEKIGDKYNEILELVKENDISLVFEVIDIINDPHIIEYKQSELIFLESFKNDLQCVKNIKTNEIIDIFKDTEIKIKECLCEIHPQDELLSYLKYIESNSKDEGVVIEDSNGFMFKLKTNFYNKWKRYRTIKEYLSKGIDIKLENAEEVEFKDFLTNQDKNKSIIELRKLFKEVRNDRD